MPAPRPKNTGRKPASTAERKAIAEAAETKFYSGDGTPIRVTHPDGAVAIVDGTPRTLPRKLWRAASREGCIRIGGEGTVGVSRQEAEAANAGAPGDEADAHQRVERIRQAMLDAVEAPENAPGFEDAFTEAEVPNLIWLSAYVGFQVDTSERDKIWGEVTRFLDNIENGDAESGAND